MTQDLVQISQEDVVIGGFGNGHRRLETSDDKRRRHGQDLPTALGCRFFHPRASGSASVVAGHLGGRSTFVQKDQLGNLHLTYRFAPRLPALLRLLAVLLLSPERFF